MSLVNKIFYCSRRKLLYQLVANRCFSAGPHLSLANAQLLDKILIANRGEIACRIIRTARRLGIRCVAVYSDPDKSSLHSQLADESYHIGPAASQKSYLNKEKIIEVAKKSGAKAIHPGYGFLSENTEFANLCEQNGIIFIGPPATAIRDMGIKSTSKEIMSAADVPVVPGYHGKNQDDTFLLNEARKMSFPVMIKAVRGGGGKGMRIAMNENEFQDQLVSARTEAMKSFGDDAMLIEKFIENPRHVEVQVFGDHYGNYVYLFERDCSVQRRHQKIIEEAPAPGLTPEIREQLGNAAVKAAAAVNYVGAGTVEFIFDPKDNKFYFMEMNTRLQVEHPITEMITGTDLVEWQLKVASRETLPIRQEDLRINGHSFEARIYAEDPNNNFMPGAGLLKRMRTPEEDASVRIETGVREHDEVSVHYDPMIAKLVVWEKDRQAALLKLRHCLSEYNIVDLKTNVDFLIRLASHEQFKQGNVYTNFIPDYYQELFPQKDSKIPDHTLCVATIASFLRENLNQRDKSRVDPFSPFNESNSRRLHGINVKRIFNFVSEGKTYQVHFISQKSHSYSITIDGNLYDNITGQYDDANSTLKLDVNGCIMTYRVLFDDENGGVSVFSNEDSHHFELAIPEFLSASTDASDAANSTKAPMPGVIEKVLVKEGQEVKSGESLVVMIAMKMEYIIKASADGVVDKVLFKEGDNVAKGAQIISFKSDL